MATNIEKRQDLVCFVEVGGGGGGGKWISREQKWEINSSVPYKIPMFAVSFHVIDNTYTMVHSSTAIQSSNWEMVL